VQVDFSVPKTKTKKRKIIKVQVQVIACDLFFIFHLKKKSTIELFITADWRV
jgi:hypothetical protein